MRSLLIAACLLAVGTYAPSAGICQQSSPPPQDQTVPAPRAAQIGSDRRTAVPQSHRASSADNSVVRRSAELHPPPGASAAGTHLSEPGHQHTGNAPLPGPVGLLLALSLVDSGGTAPAPHASTPQAEIH